MSKIKSYTAEEVPDIKCHCDVDGHHIGYTECMTGWCRHWKQDKKFQYAIVDKNKKLIGYLGYVVDWYVSKAYNFGLFSFERENLQVPKDVFRKLEELVSTLHRVEWRAVGGNPACRGYDNFISRHNGTKHILRDAIRDADGNYRDDIIYEIVRGGGVDA
ncbi:MAG: hypothetical protein KHW88_03610 [Lachnospiraceae bacterium]|nr:hypothetical protein [Lachnospiraceae bacterium]